MMNFCKRDISNAHDTYAVAIQKISMVESVIHFNFYR